MGKVKEFISKPKNGAILGIIGCSIILIFSIISNFIYNSTIRITSYNSIYIGFLIYFISILIRLKGKKINIKIIKIVVIIGIIINGAMTGIDFIRGMSTLSEINQISKLENGSIIYSVVMSILPLIGYIITLLYTITIFKIKNINLSINNKIFLIGYLVGFIVPKIILIFQSGIIAGYNQVIYIVGMLLLVPYFYNYYNILKGGK